LLDKERYLVLQAGVLRHGVDDLILLKKKNFSWESSACVNCVEPAETV
jgi:hypothetical protein